MGRQADPEGHPGPRRREDGAEPAPMPSWCRTTAAASLMAPSRPSHAWPDRRRGRRQGGGAHGRRHPLRPGRLQGRRPRRARRPISAAPSSTASAPWASGRHQGAQTSSARNSTSPWPVRPARCERPAGNTGHSILHRCFFIGAPLSGPSGGDCTLPRSVFLWVEQLYSDLSVLAPFSIPGVRRLRIAA
jgi:hypothetical protein